MKLFLLNKAIMEKDDDNDEKLNHFIDHPRSWNKHKEYYLQFQVGDY